MSKFLLERRREANIKALCKDYEVKKALAVDQSVGRLKKLDSQGAARMRWTLMLINPHLHDPDDLCDNWRKVLLDPKDGTDALNLFNTTMMFVERSHRLVHLDAPQLAKENEDLPMSSKEMRRSMLRQHTNGHPRKEWAFKKDDEGDDDKEGKREASRKREASPLV